MRVGARVQIIPFPVQQLRKFSGIVHSIVCGIVLRIVCGIVLRIVCGMVWYGLVWFGQIVKLNSKP